MLIILIVGGVMALVAGGMLLTDFGAQPRAKRTPDRDRSLNFDGWPDRDLAERNGSPEIDHASDTTRSPDNDRSPDTDGSPDPDASGWRLHAVLAPVDRRSHTVSGAA